MLSLFEVNIIRIYVNDEYAMSGVDATEIEDGATYAFKVEK